MDITAYTQGEKASSDKALFGAIGHMLTDVTVHKKLGMAITSRPGDLWHVGMSGRKVVGFALSRILSTGKAAHIRFIYAFGDADAERNLLLAALDTLRERGAIAVHSNDRKTNTLWKDNGFIMSESARRGEFVRWELKMEKR
jgi:hypothetical protein